MMTDLLGRERYRIDRQLGIGAMGTVHLAYDTILDRVVAIKVLAEHLAADEAFRHRFVREARLAARLCHPNIVQVFDAGDDGFPFLVMEYVDGETVANRLAHGRGFAGDELVALLTQLSAGLTHAHAAGIVHRDVKPHNILIRHDGVAKLTDFGIARAVAEGGLTEIGTVLGTAPYMAPEQAAGEEAGPAADVYALGALARQITADALPPEIETLVDAALSPDPDARPCAKDFHTCLVARSEGLTDIIPILAPPPDAAPTEVRSAAGGTELMPPAVDGTDVSSADDGTQGPSPRRFITAIIALFGLFILFAALHVAGSGDNPAGSNTATTVTSSARTIVPSPGDPTQTARDFASWLRGQSN